MGAGHMSRPAPLTCAAKIRGLVIKNQDQAQPYKIAIMQLECTLKGDSQTHSGECGTRTFSIPTVVRYPKKGPATYNLTEHIAYASYPVSGARCPTENRGISQHH